MTGRTEVPSCFWSCYNRSVHRTAKKKLISFPHGERNDSYNLNSDIESRHTIFFCLILPSQSQVQKNYYLRKIRRHKMGMGE